MAKFELSGRVALVTGASSGIGQQMAELLAERGAELVLVARSRDKLEALARELSKRHGTRARVYAADLAEPGAVFALSDWLAAEGVEVHTLINNAGVGRARSVAADSPETLNHLLDLNVRALTELTQRLLPGMVARKSGGVLLVASLVSFFPVPQMAAYAASKAYVRSFGEALAAELQGTGVHVTVLCPGNVPSGFQAAAGFAEGAVSTPGELSARETARRALWAFERRRGRVIPGLLNQLAALGTTLVPNVWIGKIAMMVLRRSGRFD